jgi:sigma-B regulation protein RsbU (phosphoserine phosphatase)
MKISLNSLKIVIPFMLFLFLLPLGYDLFKFYSDVNIPSLDYISEVLMIGLGLLCYRLIINEYNFQDKTIQENLRIFVYLLGLLYILVIVCKLLLNPSFSPASFPQLPETFSSVIYANIISLVAIVLMTPILIILKNLIYYKRTQRTIFIMRGLVLFSIATIIATVVSKAELNLEFTGAGIYNNSLLIGVLVCIFLLSFRNAWISYLTRREKISYFFISLFLIWAVFYLFDFAFAFAVPAHSLGVAVFANITWYLLVSYTIFSCFYLLLHLPTARVFDRKMKEVDSLHDLSRTISTEFNFDRLVHLVTDMTRNVIGADYAWLEMYRNDAKEMTIVAHFNLNDGEIHSFNQPALQEFRSQIFHNKKSLLLNQLIKTHPYYFMKKWKSEIQSLICVPLISGNGQPLGILYAAKKHTFGFDPDDLAMVEAYASQAVIALDNANLLRESLEQERLKEELRIAREVQQRLLPQNKPLLKDIEIESLTITAYEVGGDYYDFVYLPDGHIGFIIGDVSGKGTSAAFYMAEAKGVVQSLSKMFNNPRELLIRTNEILYATLERKTFISMLMASMDCKKRQISFARAGHCPLLYYNKPQQKVSLLQPQGIGVGLEKGQIFTQTLVEESISFNLGDIFVFFTDGLSEARNKSGEEFGEERLCSIIQDNAHKPVSDIKQIILETILQFLDGQSLADDLTLLLVKT